MRGGGREPAIQEKRTDKSGFTGSGWLKYVGPERHGSDAAEEFGDPDAMQTGARLYSLCGRPVDTRTLSQRTGCFMVMP